jgi:hypothetical protein
LNRGDERNGDAGRCGEVQSKSGQTRQRQEQYVSPARKPAATAAPCRPSASEILDFPQTRPPTTWIRTIPRRAQGGACWRPSRRNRRRSARTCSDILSAKSTMRPVLTDGRILCRTPWAIASARWARR